MPGDRRKILIVEDSPMMSRMYRLVLGERYELAVASDGAEALDAAALDPAVDLMVVDINMPRMDGLEFIRRLRTELGMREVPVLVCSTETAPEDRLAAREAGATDFLAKPWTPGELRDAVGGLLGEGA